MQWRPKNQPSTTSTISLNPNKAEPQEPSIHMGESQEPALVDKGKSPMHIIFKRSGSHMPIGVEPQEPIPKQGIATQESTPQTIPMDGNQNGD